MRKVQKFVDSALCDLSQVLSIKARLALLTVLVFMGVSWGLGSALGQLHAKTGATRGSGASLCKQASIAFDPALPVQQMCQLLSSEYAYILYGPDEFG